MRVFNALEQKIGNFMKSITSLALLLLSFLIQPSSYASVGDCPVELKKHNLCAQISWKLGPQYGAYSKAVVTYWKKGLKKEGFVDPSPKLEVYPWMIMPGMEHGGSKVKIKKLSKGTYEVDQILFLKMQGFWELRFKEQGAHPKKGALAKNKILFPKKK